MITTPSESPMSSNPSILLPMVYDFKNLETTLTVRNNNNKDFLAMAPSQTAWPDIDDYADPASYSLDPAQSPSISDFLSTACLLEPADDDQLGWPFVQKYIEPEFNQLMELRPENSSAVYIDKQYYLPFARLALDYFNKKEEAHFELLQVTAVGVRLSPPVSLVHINFEAKLKQTKAARRKLFYAELKTRYLHQIEENGVKVIGCSLLKVVDTGNPLGLRCGYCEDDVVHPGPLHGCTVVAGDYFEDSLFWSYGQLSLDPSLIQEWTTKDIEMYTVCADKAVNYLNDLVGNCKFVRVVGAVDAHRGMKKIIHLNFIVKVEKAKTKEELCFAEVSLPFFRNDSPHRWDVRKEPFLRVQGCCILESCPVHPFGRACDICKDGLAHPGPKYGYEAVVGDGFVGYMFKECGNGVFCEGV